MAGIINKPLALFRRPESPRPLHTRWGDADISVPTDGSWNQYDNPHHTVQERQKYGPGFVPDFHPSDYNQNRSRQRENKRDDPEEKENRTSNPRNSTSLARSSSLSLGPLRPSRLSVRLASRPKHLQSETKIEQESHESESRRHDFAYKPIQQDYTAEASENTRVKSPPFKYIPTNGRYLEDLRGPSPGPRSQSAMSFRSSSGTSTRRDSYTDSIYENDRTFARRGSHQDDDRRSLRSNSGEYQMLDAPSSRHRYGLPPRRRTSPFVPADRKRASLLKPMTLAMVPDPDELYE
ncbi:hypothetical protein N7456_004750 [Penicillium angulare]|uniref:Uncharacterized protein n=1 Tax=Penicillium angulare TaxID=116970 RepID=A0A9W9KIW4_9EURO|nr:hypothetical protein N7456_004750 [Penicillium angulare]